MRRPVLLLLAASLTLASCGGWRDSRLNPGNWFGRSREVQTPAADTDVNPLIPTASAISKKPADDRHVPIGTITELRVERTLTGAIVHATGIAARQGAFDARLSPATPGGIPEDGVLAYTFEIVYPVNPRPVGSEHTRTIVVARALTNQNLQSVRLIRVTAAGNSREARRR